ncbi:hypothetical protein K435DRAFT_857021 [Dendrothele bispora CBS 962.96]|uniref:Uncharacterized protein n=1 Tax=Dendrothele bispora (strain CBS 962.96) TaxID=1314807 RepID=A0A4S8M718_DENBC|nr:hypothetical protein K435DRAFT_857021 [Dendrothele bispora CBS 962.96]
MPQPNIPHGFEDPLLGIARASGKLSVHSVHFVLANLAFGASEHLLLYISTGKACCRLSTNLLHFNFPLSIVVEIDADTGRDQLDTNTSTTQEAASLHAAGVANKVPDEPVPTLFKSNPLSPESESKRSLKMRLLPLTPP